MSRGNREVQEKTEETRQWEKRNIKNRDREAEVGRGKRRNKGMNGKG
jgi:hypothetical protein